MELLVTDVTEMKGGNYCVGGWSPVDGRMVRPLPNGSNWTAAELSKFGIAVGTTIDVTAAGQPSGSFPHKTEDTPIDLNKTVVVQKGFSDWAGAKAPQSAKALGDAFDGNIKNNSTWKGTLQGVYVSPNIVCKSLAAINIDRNRISFVEEFGKLKAIVDDGVAKYKLTVSSRVLKEAYRKGGLAAVNAALPARKVVHVRVGLARSYGNPPKCYLMVNGVL